MNKTLLIGAAALMAAILPANAARGGKTLSLPDGSRVERQSLAFPHSPTLSLKDFGPLSTDVSQAPRANAQTAAEVKPISKWYKEDVADDNINYWVFQCMGLGAFPKGIVHGTTPEAANRDNILLWGPMEGRDWAAGEFIVNSGCMVGDEYWAYCSHTWAADLTNEPDGIYQIDLNSGERVRKIYDDTENQENYNCVLNEMSYDPQTEYVYGLRKIASGYLGWEISMEMEIVRIDPRNPARKWEVIGTVDYAFTMACDDGYMYLVQPDFKKTGVDEEGNDVLDIVSCTLYKINLEDYGSFTQDDLEKVGLINQGFLNVNYLQTMDFDHSDHTLYWMGSKYDDAGTGFITTLDTETAETGDPLWNMVDRTQYVALAIPYELADKKAPHYVRSLSYLVGSDGQGKVDFSWTNPTKNTEKKALDALTGIKVYRDDALVATLSANGTGEQQTWSDNDVASGFHNYRFVPYNSKGDGLSRSRTIFIGRDVPGAPTGVSVVTSGTSATISWNAAALGANNGWYDKSTLKYKVTRLPDNKVVAASTSETSVSDLAEVFGGYSYVVTPSNADGEGPSAVSAIVPFGPNVTIPYINNLETEVRANEMTIVDNNADGTRFTYSLSPNDGSPVWLYDFCAGKPDDWVISPEFAFESGKKYRVLVTYATSNYRDTQELLHIKQGKTNKVADQTVTLATMVGESKYYGAYRTEVVTDVDPANGNFISFHVDSEPNQGWVVFAGIEVREYSAKDMSALDLMGSQLAYVNSENFYQVTVKNEGNANVRAAKARLVKADGTVLGEADVPAIRPGETKTVEVSWTPFEAGEFTIYGNVYLEGDTFEADNTYAIGIPVSVREGSASRWTTVLHQDAVSWIPFYVYFGNCESTTIYTAAEVGKKDVSLTGVAFTYTPADDTTDEGLKNVTFDIYACQTDKDRLFDGENFTLVDGLKKLGSTTVDLNGTAAKNDVTIVFDEPLPFDGNHNLCLRGVATLSNPTSNNPYWFVQNEYGRDANTLRSIYGINDSNYTSFYPPVIKLGYTDATGVKGVIAVGGVRVNGNVVDFGTEMQSVAVYDITGRKVLSAAGVDNVVLPSGLFIVEGIDNGVRSVTKVIIK